MNSVLICGYAGNNESHCGGYEMQEENESAETFLDGRNMIPPGFPPGHFEHRRSLKEGEFCENKECPFCAAYRAYLKMVN